MKSATGCPDTSRLSAMLDETLSFDEQHAVQQHVDGCQACQLRLDAMAADNVNEQLPLRDLSADLLLSAPQATRATPNQPALPTGDDLKSSSQPGEPTSHRPPFAFLEPSPEPLALGRLAHYDVLEVIGRGGMGIVFKARDLRLHRIVAIKALAPELASSGAARQRFLREARSAAAISHDHIITIYAVEQGPVPYLVMELIDGQSLQQKIEQSGQLDLLEILRIGYQIAAGLAAAHALGLTHRDIKPANILLQNGIQRVQITDFGLARAADDAGITAIGEVAGTPQYMSPEQALGQCTDARSDLFSLGSVLYAMATGRSPFRAESPVAVLRRVCDDSPLPIRDINPQAPPWLALLIDKLLAKNPDQRYQTAAEVAALLGQHLAELQNPAAAPASALAPASAKRANGQAARRRGWVIGALGLVAALGVLGVTEATSVTDLTSTVIRVVSGEGALIVELDDPTIKVTIDGEEVVITEAGAREVRVRPGRHRVAATKDGKPVAVSEDLVTISRGGRRVVRVTYDSPTVQPLPPPGVLPTPSESPAGSASRDLINIQRQIAASRSLANAPFGAAAAAEYQEIWARKLELPVQYTNSVGMSFRLIPPGQFQMGSPQPDVDEALPFVQALPLGPELLQSETPQHPVQLREAWWLGVVEVTQEQYEAVCGANPSYFPAQRRAAAEAANLDRTAEAADGPLRRFKFAVDSVTWQQAVEFCNRLSRREGLAAAYVWEAETWTLKPGPGYRLPTEAQWEFACRAGTGTRYNFSTNGSQGVSGYVWFTRNSGRRTHEVGTLRPNPFGLYDMLGNVAEWCQDGWNPLGYAQSDEEVAVDPGGPLGGFSLRVIRGGNWQSGPVGVRPASRGAAQPQVAHPTIGIRVLLPVAGVKALVMSSGASVSSSPAEPPKPRGKPP